MAVEILLVDDSMSILAFETEALSSLYQVSTALHGGEALARLRREPASLVVLDLSMPEVNGEEVLAAMRAHPDLAAIPVLVVSSEVERGQRCLTTGAQAFLPKPVRAEALRAAVARLLAEAAERTRHDGLQVLPLLVGPVELTVPLAIIDTVSLQCRTEPLAGGPAYLTELVRVDGEAVAVLDLAERLGVTHARPLLERMLVVLRVDGHRLALCVDQVLDPEEYAPGAFTRQGDFPLGAHGPLEALLEAVVQTARGPRPVVRPQAFLQPGLTRRLPELLERHGHAP